MPRTRSSTLTLIGLLVLIALALHPVPNVENVAEFLFRPARFLGELARPFRWLDASSARAADSQVEAALEGDRARGRELLLAVQRAALPTDPALDRGRALIGAHVVARAANRADEIVVRFPADAGIEAGWPVVAGDVYVGRLAALDPLHPGEGRVQLVTARDFRVSAEVVRGAERGRLVVGGLVGEGRETRAELDLVAHFPSRRDLTTGSVRVRGAGESPELALADGFLLGELGLRTVRGARLLAVRAAIDYGHGLNHVAIVCPPQLATAGPVLALDPFDPRSWTRAALVIDGSASTWRAARKIVAGRDAGVRLGAAVARGARLVGRVTRVGPWTSDVSLLDDPGFSVGALARIQGVETPHALGRIVSLGRDAATGDVCFAWDAVVTLAPTPAGSVKAELFTAAGDRDVPPGLVLGATTIPTGTGIHVLRVANVSSNANASAISVWRGPESEPRSEEDS